MGYQTEFEGEFTITDKNGDQGMRGIHAVYINAFGDSRRMRRDETKTAKLPDPVREKVGLPVGVEGAYYVGGSERSGGDVLDYNKPPAGQPGLWCKWEVSPDCTVLRWSGAEKFYDYVEWLEYLIQHFFTVWGYVLNGTVTWEGEEQGDIGKIVVKDNVVTARKAKLVYEGEDDEDDKS